MPVSPTTNPTTSPARETCHQTASTSSGLPGARAGPTSPVLDLLDREA
jgi:hypothetical protein